MAILRCLEGAAGMMTELIDWAKTHKEYNMREANSTLTLFHVILKLNSHFTVIKLSASSKINALIKFVKQPKHNHL